MKTLERVLNVVYVTFMGSAFGFIFCTLFGFDIAAFCFGGLQILFGLALIAVVILYLLSDRIC